MTIETIAARAQDAAGLSASSRTDRIVVCHVINSLATGGAQKMLAKLLAGLDRQRFASAVVALRDGPVADEIRALDVPVITCAPPGGLPRPLAFLRLLAWLRRLEPHVVHGWLYHGNLAAHLCAAALPGRVPVVWGIRHTPADLGQERPLTARLIRLEAAVSRWPARIVYNSSVSAEWHESLGYCRERRVVIPNGFDCERFHPDPEARRIIRTELGVPPAARLVGYVARYHPMKNHAGFLAAAARLAPTMPDVHWVLVGQGVTRENPQLRAAVEELGLGSRVHLLGERADMPRLTAAFDVAALFSGWGEGFPNVIGEAMASGVPCVVSDVGDAARVVSDCGRSVPANDVAALTTALGDLLALAAADLARLGHMARSRIEEHFALDHVASVYARLYAELGGRR